MRYENDYVCNMLVASECCTERKAPGGKQWKIPSLLSQRVLDEGWDGVRELPFHSLRPDVGECAKGMWNVDWLNCVQAFEERVPTQTLKNCAFEMGESKMAWPGVVHPTHSPCRPDMMLVVKEKHIFLCRPGRMTQKGLTKPQ